MRLFDSHDDARLREAVNELREGPPRILLVGSAISAPAPSRLPMVGEALSDVLRALVDSCEARRVHFGDQRDQVLGLSARVKFELFFAVLSDYLGASQTRNLVANVYSQQRPNHNHEAIALLASQNPVFTTNFDEDIEACSKSRPIVHLHGLASEPNGLVITLGQLANRERPSLDAFRSALNSIPRLACIGYSGWGDVDIFPLIQQFADRPDTDIMWFEFRTATPPVRARLYRHDLFLASNALTLWAGTDSVAGAETEELDGPDFAVLARELANAQTTTTLLRILASVAHEARFGPLGLRLYELACEVGGAAAVSHYEWGVAYERANDRRLAAQHLVQAAEESSGDERISHYAGAAFCYRLVGRVEEALDIYERARSALVVRPDTPYSFLDNVLRGRAGLHLKLAAQISKVGSRLKYLEESGVEADLEVLERAQDPLNQRPGRLQLLLEMEQLELQSLAGDLPKDELAERARELWTTAKGFQDLEIEARLARLAASIDKALGRRLLADARRDILRNGGSRRDLRKVVVAWAGTFIPFLPGRWFLLTPTEILRSMRIEIGHPKS